MVDEVIILFANEHFILNIGDLEQVWPDTEIAIKALHGIQLLIQELIFADDLTQIK